MELQIKRKTTREKKTTMNQFKLLLKSQSQIGPVKRSVLNANKRVYKQEKEKRGELDHTRKKSREKPRMTFS
jgi:hypothetical protein